MQTKILVLIIALIASFITAPGPLFLKKVSLKKMDLYLLLNKNLYFAAFFYIIGISMTTYALQFGEVSSIGPIFSLLYVWVTLLSVSYLKEEVNTKLVFGILLVIAGIIFVTI